MAMSPKKSAKKGAASADKQPKPLSYYLRHKIDQDALFAICEHLGMMDLMQMCGLDTEDDAYFLPFIRDQVISRKLVDFRPRSNQTVWYLTETLETFGQFIKRLSIPMRPVHFNHILRQIVTYCAVERITEIHFKSHFTSEDWSAYENTFTAEMFEGGVRGRMPTIDETLVQQAAPYFARVEKLYIQGEFTDYHKLFSTLINSSSLRLLQLQNFKSHARNERPIIELITADTLNLTTLHLADGDLFGKTEEFIAKLPHLEEYIWEGRQNKEEVNAALVKYCPKLRYYCNFCEDFDGNPRYFDFLGKFNHLTEVAITSKLNDASDIKGPLQILARKGLLRKLTIFKSTAETAANAEPAPPAPAEEPPFSYYKEFAGLTSIAFQFPTESGIFDIAKFSKFFYNLVTGMESLTTLTLIGDMKMFNLSKLIQCVPRVREIDMHRLEVIHQVPVEVRRIKRTVQEMIDERHDKHADAKQNADRIRLIVNPTEAREFRVLKNIDKIFDISVKRLPQRTLCFTVR